MNEWLDHIYFGNTVRSWLFALGIIIALMLLIRVFRLIILSRLRVWSQRTQTTLDDFIISMIQKSVLPIFYVVAIYAGLQYLTLSPKVLRIMHILLATVITFFVVRLVSVLVRHLLDAWMSRRSPDTSRKLQLRGIMIVLNIVIWSIGLVFLLDNIGYDVTAVVTGLGIGGIAIALAVQKILGDLFSYFVIFFDRPFEIGDFIVLGDMQGTVEHVGLKTTRLKSLSGEELIISNSDLTNSRVRNYRKMLRRRVAFRIRVAYHTTEDKLKHIPLIVTGIINSIDKTSIDRVHFVSFENLGLDFEVVYFVESGDYNLYMDIQQRINLEMKSIFEKEGIEFVYATPTKLVPPVQYEGGN